LTAAFAATVPAHLHARAERTVPGSYPFTLGVASGYPRPDGFVLWTRLAPEPLAPGGGMSPDAVVPVQWEVAADERMRRPIRAGVGYAQSDWAHSLHIEPAGLDPGRDYWYRFRTGDFVSPVGRARTAAASGQAQRAMRIAVASCQQFEHGYYAAYRHMAGDHPDLVLHLGDYIYELSWGQNLVRSHGSPECYTLDDYRSRHALYRSDPDLQAAHAQCPWLVTWDDHEVDNDHAASVSEEDDPQELFLARRAAAYRAYYEHMPLPRRAVPFGAFMRLYAERSFGGLARILMLDGRQYRSPHACPPRGRRGGHATWCEEIFAPGRTMLGQAQEEWLAARLGSGGVCWNILGQQTVMTRIDEQPGPGERYWTDSWNGYAAARTRLMNTFIDSGTANPVVLSGDIHAFGVANLRADVGNPDSAVIASELVTTSISSQTVADKLGGQVLGENRDLLFGEAKFRGYLRIDLTPQLLRADLVALDDVTRRESGRRVIAAYVVEAGRPGPQRA
jgi:alkaline phosphatase D